MRVAECLDKHFPPKGQWQGVSLGGTTVVWWAFIRSEGDHQRTRRALGQRTSASPPEVHRPQGHPARPDR